MGKFIDLTGQKFGKLTVIKRENNNKYGSATWMCKCDCGNETIVMGSNLKRKEIISCGCYPKGVVPFPNGEADAHKLFRDYKFKAKNKDIPFELSLEEFLKLTSGNCFYCGAKPSQIKKSGRTKNSDSYIYNGIDRINSNEGYTKENTVTCCWKCNRAKSTMMQKDFFEWVNNIYKNLRNKKLV